jgi:hypothetical protein
MTHVQNHDQINGGLQGYQAIPLGAAQSSQESLLEMIRPLIHIEAGNTLPNLPGKWQLN